MSNNQSQSEVSRIALEAFQIRHSASSFKGGLRSGQPAIVTRLDHPGAYFLIPIHDNAGLCGIVQLDAEGLSLETSSVILDPNSTFLAPEDSILAAVQTAFPDREDWRKPFLAWQPCRESFDSARPLWVVPYSNGQVYVTQDCRVFETLAAGRGG